MTMDLGHEEVRLLRERALHHSEKAAIGIAKADEHRALAEHLADEAERLAEALGYGRTEADVYEDLIEAITAGTPDHGETIIMEPWGVDGAALIHGGTIDPLAAAFAALVEMSHLQDAASVVDILRDGPIRLLRRVQHLHLPADTGLGAEGGEGPWNLAPFTVFWLGRWEDIPPNVEDLVHNEGGDR